MSGGNKVKVKKGAATFKDVRVTAEEAGCYALRVQSASRKVVVADAVLHLTMQPLNAVRDLRVLLPESLLAGGGEGGGEGGGCQAGTSAEVRVALLTENGAALPAEVAASSLTLRVTPPGGASVNWGYGDRREGGGGGGGTGWPLHRLLVLNCADASLFLVPFGCRGRQVRCHGVQPGWCW